MAEAFDVVFLGGGPGGYTGAIRAAQLGLSTAVIEMRKTLGGTCLNVGCIPSKALLESSEHFSAAQHDMADHGVMLSSVKLDLAKMLSRKEKIVGDLTKGIEFLMKKNKITWIQGRGQLKSATDIEVTAEDGSKQTVTARNIILATGSTPNELPFLKYDGKVVVSSTEALSFDKVPKHLIVIGGGYIGLEMGSVWLRLGAKVTVVEFGSMICGTMDLQTSKKLHQILKKQGMEFLLSSKVTGASLTKNSAKLKYEAVDGSSSGEIEGDVVLVATGRRPLSEGLGLEQLGIEMDQRGTVIVDDHFRTKYPHIYAVGDLIPGPMLAHKAEEEGVAVAEIIAGHAGHVNYETVPGVIYTWPEVASVGLTEEQAKAKDIKYKTGSFPFSANARAKALGYTEGQVKILADEKTDRIIGVHIIGPRASDLIAEAVVAMEFGSSSEDLARSFHGHPTLSEVVREAALAVDKRARQM